MTQVASKHVGARQPRVEDPRLVTGRGRYVDDITLPRMAHVVFVRSPHAHARVVSIDTETASRMRGVVACLTARDLDGVRVMRADDMQLTDYKVTEWSALAVGKVRYVGEAVAAVVAEDLATAEDAAERIVVDYELLPAVVTAEDALAAAASRVHDHWTDNVLMRAKGQGGDVEAAFARAAVRLVESFQSAPVTAAPLETRGCVAEYDGGTGKLTLWTSHQSPHVVRTLLAELLGFPEQAIHVIPPDIGGGFGIKLHMYPEDLIVAWATRRFGRPVKWVQGRLEDLQCNVYCRDHRITIELAATADGRVEGMRARVVTNAGAYSILPFGSTLEATGAARQILGPYRIASYAYEATAVVSNTQPRGAYRGVAMVTTTFSMERMMDLLAERLGLDPAEVRRRNLITNAEFPYTNALGVNYEGASFEESLRAGLRELGYEALREEQARGRATGRYLGIGICCYAEFTAASAKALLWRGIVRVPGFDAATVRVDPSGVVRVYASTTAMGQGIETALAQLVADELGVGLDHIRVSCGDSTLAPYGSGSWGSRGAVVGGGATILAARKVRDKVLAIAAHRLEAPPADLELKDGRVAVRGASFRSVAFADLAKQAYMVSPVALPEGISPGLDVTEYYDPPIQTISNGAHFAVVEVDVDTGLARLVRYLVVHDCGTVINPLIVDGQIHGGVAQGVGEALWEGARYDAGGQLLTSSFMDYPLPRATDLPGRFDIFHIETPSPLTVGGIKGMGEGGTIGAVGAVVNAVADALRPFGANIAHIPLTPEDVWRIASRGKEGARS